MPRSYEWWNGRAVTRPSPAQEDAQFIRWAVVVAFIVVLVARVLV